jgi:hypothetical protein
MTMRKIRYWTTQKYGADEQDYPYLGMFHGWFQCANEDGWSNPVAIIELDDGRCFQAEPSQIKFVDKADSGVTK